MSILNLKRRKILLNLISSVKVIKKKLKVKSNFNPIIFMVRSGGCECIYVGASSKRIGGKSLVNGSEFELDCGRL